MFSRIILILLSLTVSEENEATDNTAATCVELQRELVRQEIETGQTPNPQHIEEAHANVTHEMCMYCRFSYENGTVLLRIRLSSTLQRRKRSPKTEPFENALQRGPI